jgi:hypothetical protein
MQQSGAAHKMTPYRPIPEAVSKRLLRLGSRTSSCEHRTTARAIVADRVLGRDGFRIHYEEKLDVEVAGVSNLSQASAPRPRGGRNAPPTDAAVDTPGPDGRCRI